MRRPNLKKYSNSRVGYTFFYEDEFERVKATALDADALGSYKEWLASVEKFKKNMAKAGATDLIPVPVTADMVAEFCERTGLPNVGNTRAQLVQEILSTSFGAEPPANSD